MKYKSSNEFSYALGAFPTFELLKKRPQLAREVLMHPSFGASEHAEKLRFLCAENNVPLHDGARRIAQISPKENVFVVGVFEKLCAPPDALRPHVLLDKVGDMGNVGTIMRTALGFGFQDMAIITPAADCFAPKTVRASMGAVFSMNVSMFASRAAYRAAYPTHKIYAFMLSGAPLENAKMPTDRRFSLAFGNEGEGLCDAYLADTPLRIEQSESVDSLNVTVAAAVALHKFRCI